ncbi:hypothetical protein D3C85_1761480 [compost metagenome]
MIIIVELKVPAIFVVIDAVIQEPAAVMVYGTWQRASFRDNEREASISAPLVETQ